MSLVYDCYEPGDECGIDADTREVCQLAIEGDAELAKFGLPELEAAESALSFCARFGCERHGWDRSARHAIEHAIAEEQARLERIEEAATFAVIHGGACGCRECV